MMNFDTFRRQISEIWSDGNLEAAYSVIKSEIDDDEPITFEAVISKFKEHIESWTQTYGGRNYVSQEEMKKRKNILDFVSLKMYKQDFSPPMHPRDSYLFPQHITIDQLYDYIRAIKEKIAQEREDKRRAAP